MAGSTTYRRLGARVELAGDKEFKQAISQLNQESKVLASEMKKLQAEYKGNTESTEYLTKAGKLLEERLQQQHEKVKYLQDQLNKASSAERQNADQINKLKIALNNAEAEEYKLQHAIEDNTAALNHQGEEMRGLGDTVDALADKFGINLPQGAKDALNGMQGFSAGTAAAMTAAAAAIAAVVKTVSDLGKLTLDVAAQVDEYITQSAITGVPTEMLQAWDYAAPLIDTDAETIKGAMTKITKAMGDAAGGSTEAQDKFSALGVSITESDGSLRSAEEVFYDVVDALGQMREGTERNAIAMDLMGKSAQELNPLFNAGSEALRKYGAEAEAAGYILDEYQIQKLGAVDDAYQKLQLTIEANRKQLAADFAPAAQSAMELFSDVVKKAGEMLKQSGIIENLASIISSLVDMIGTIGELVAASPSIQAAIKAIDGAMTALAYTIATIADGFNVVAGLLPHNWGSGKLKTALGLNASQGQYSNLQRLNGTASVMDAQLNGYVGNGGADMSGYGYDSATGLYYDKITGNYIFPHNAKGTESWRGGLTWVGENGPELVDVPQGSTIYDSATSREMVSKGDTITNYFNINVDDLQDLQKLIAWGKTAKNRARTMNRMDLSSFYVHYPNLG
ncbi:MAG: hypothetical protein IKB61_04965 [Elusimicrobiaceae bacterium]|nr:hypothetical protein [Elusimicrobiaceae bacterium]